MNSAEALHNMQYTCESCGHSEMIWNSRDGVTPFTVSCSKCGGLSSHSGNWNKEKSFKTLPDDASRVFVEVFKKDAVAVCTAWVERYYHQMVSGGYIKDVSKEQLIADKVEERMKDHCPSLITRDQYISKYHLL